MQLQNLLFALQIGLLLLIFYQDLKYKAVTWVLFPLLFLCFSISALYGNSEKQQFFLQTSYNLFYLGFVVFGLIAYFYIRSGNLKKSLFRQIGLGDILFFLVCTTALDFVLYMFYFMLSLIVSLIVGMIWYRGNTIPLAGIQAICLAPLLLALKLNLITIGIFWI